MGKTEARLDELGIVLPRGASPVANYLIVRRAGSELYCSGQGPKADGGSKIRGKLGRDCTVQQGYDYARRIGLQLLAAVQHEVGTLDRVECVVKLLGFVNAEPDFTEHPQVINGCSDVFVEVLGERGRHARSAVGMSSLPGGIPCEVEAIFKIFADDKTI